MIRKAQISDLSRIAEIYVFNNRINYYPIFNDINYSFGYMQVETQIAEYFSKKEIINHIYVFEDNGIIKGFIEIQSEELVKLYVEPCFQNSGIGAELIEFAKAEFNVKFLWALLKNHRAINFYHRHGFFENGEKEFEVGTTEYIIKLVRKKIID